MEKRILYTIILYIKKCFLQLTFFSHLEGSKNSKILNNLYNSGFPLLICTNKSRLEEEKKYIYYAFVEIRDPNYWSTSKLGCDFHVRHVFARTLPRKRGKFLKNR